MAGTRDTVLIVDDELSVRDSLHTWFRKEGFDATAAASAQEALRAAEASHIDVAILDIKMPGMDGLALQERLRALDPQLSVIIMTAYGSVETAVQALKQGAFDYVTKPIDPDELTHLVRRALEQRRLRKENTLLRETISGMVEINPLIGESEAMRRVTTLIQHVAETDATVLILGESGTGKELIARAIHAGSPRRFAPIIPVNCGAMPENLLESELFGHEKGAFTSAHERVKGRLELADGGTLFLDEVGSISAKMQVDLLRVLETKEFTRIGATHPTHANFRVICATNENLEVAVREDRFREDFYYRINVFTIEAPPLRARRSDIPLLAGHFVTRFASQMGKRITGISPEAMKLLCDHDWPGNVRELSNAIERAMVVGRPPLIVPDDLPMRGRSIATENAGESLADVERRHIAAVLERTRGNVTEAAEILKVDRVTVYNKIKKYGLRPTEPVK